MRRPLVAANLVALVVLAYAVIGPTFAPHGSPAEILRQLAEHHVHGPRDDLLGPSDLSRIAARGTVMATCGPTSVWAESLLEAQGYEARIVTTLTLDEWNSLDNGHTLVSVLEPSGWVVYDVDRHVYYTDEDGRQLNLAELVARVPTDAYEIVALGPQTYGEGVIRETNRRLMQVAGIGADGRYWFAADDPGMAARIKSYAPGYETLPTVEWRARFY